MKKIFVFLLGMMIFVVSFLLQNFSSSKVLAQDVYCFTKNYNGRLVDSWIDSNSIEWRHTAGYTREGARPPYNDLKVNVKYVFRSTNRIAYQQQYQFMNDPDYLDKWGWFYQVGGVNEEFFINPKHCQKFNPYSNTEVGILFRKCVPYMPERDRGFTKD